MCYRPEVKWTVEWLKVARRRNDLSIVVGVVDFRARQRLLAAT